jgi:putative endonuclease
LRRVIENKRIKGFSKKYNVDKLVWFALGESVESAILLEKKIKNRKRQWEIDLIEKNNPNRIDLSRDL